MGIYKYSRHQSPSGIQRVFSKQSEQAGPQEERRKGDGSEMARRWLEDGSKKQASKQTPGILNEYGKSMARVWLEYGWSMGKVWVRFALMVVLTVIGGVMNEVWGQTTIHDLTGIDNQTGSYFLASDFSTSGTPSGGIGSSADNPFKGTIDGQLVTITGTWNKPLFDYVEDAVIKNIIIENASISQTGIVGTIASTASGDSRIYNCGILNGTVGSTGAATDQPKTANACGGLVGLLNGTSRVINCYSYATITGGNRVGGLVGYNNGTTTAGSITTMIMNCIFYGDITGGYKVSPVYGGNNITNLKHDSNRSLDGLNTFNYYAFDELKTKSIDFYNCALAVENKYLTRFEIYRQLLNSNKKLAAFYATGDKDNASQMAKWVLETADRQNTNPYPYPILKAQGRYPSIINIDTIHAEQLAFDENGRISETDRNKGGRIGTLSVSISESNTTSGGQTKPTGATVETTSLTLVRTDKDENRFNFNYDKVQLPYYNDVGTNNYTNNKVVTGWKITGITTLADDPYTSANYNYSKTYADNPEYFDGPNYNFADRKSSQKDLYSVSGRVFSQGAYFDVPYGVTSITIEPYWGNATYVSDEYLDVVYNKGYTAQRVTQLEKQFDFNDQGKATGVFNSQDVYTTTFKDDGSINKTAIANALGAKVNNQTVLSGSTVYDNAVVLVGNLHQGSVPSDGNKPFTMMSVDLDNDREPDCSMIYHHNTRSKLAPMRFDFLNIPGTAQAQKPYETGTILNAAIFRTLGWFEITNTAFIYFTQYEYENTGTSVKKEIDKTEAPLILLGGYIDQFVSAQSRPLLGKTIYIHVGGNVLINSFGLGTHSDGSGVTQHIPVSVTGGDYNGFYLSGTYNQDAAPCDDNAECYISGGRFGELAGAAQEQIGSTNSASKGNVTWQIYNADITDFYGGGVNDAKPVQGSITTDIFNSHVTTFCGGPKFGNMASGKTVTTTAEGCTFNKFFGAGFGGNSYSRKKYFDNNKNVNWGNLQNNYTNDKGKYYNGTTTGLGSGNPPQYGYKGPGVATDFDYELFVWTSGTTGGRFFVKFVSFSLAQCNDVESTLKKCIINNNFYGGGSLGKVSGTATSTLEDCDVTGNVFGAGYSATLPQVPVRTGGFKDANSYPSINTKSGMFEAGVLSDTVHYNWKHVDSYPANNSVGFKDNDGNYNTDGHNVVTTVDITKNNLGSVGSAVLTLQGTTTVGGSVYGGGEQSTINGTGTLGNAIVTLKGNVIVEGDVFGGGDNGNVSGSTEVNIED